MLQYTLLQKIMLWLPPLLFAITVHETAHGWAASKLGDQTAKLLGRLSLNPMKHIDLVGTIIVPIALLVLGGFMFGWAKPVPVSWQNLKNPQRDMALVAVAGPMANLLMAVLWALIAKLAALFYWQALFYMGTLGIMINTVLMVLNLIPIPPLDWSRVIASFMSPAMANKFKHLENFGFFILIILLATGLLSRYMAPIVDVILAFFASLVRL